jgi:hypothetical protein
MEDFAGQLRRAGYRPLEARTFILGGIGLHWAAKE